MALAGVLSRWPREALALASSLTTNTHTHAELVQIANENVTLTKGGNNKKARAKFVNMVVSAAVAFVVAAVAESFSVFAFSMHFPLVVNALSSAAAAAAKVDNSSSSNNNIISCPARHAKECTLLLLLYPATSDATRGISSFT